MRVAVLLIFVASCGGSWEPSGAPLSNERPAPDLRAVPKGSGWVCTAVEEPMLLCAREEAQCASMHDQLLEKAKDADHAPLDCTHLPRAFVFTAAKHAYYARSMDECEDLARALVNREIVTSPSRCVEAE